MKKIKIFKLMIFLLCFFFAANALHNVQQESGIFLKENKDSSNTEVKNNDVNKITKKIGTVPDFIKSLQVYNETESYNLAAGNPVAGGNKSESSNPSSTSSCTRNVTITPSASPNVNCCFDITILAGIDPIDEFYLDVPASSTDGTVSTPPLGWSYTFTPGTDADRFNWFYSGGSTTSQVILGNICFNNPSQMGQLVGYGFSYNGNSWVCYENLPILVPCIPSTCYNHLNFVPYVFPNYIECCYRVYLEGTEPINAFYIDVPHLSTWAGQSYQDVTWSLNFDNTSSSIYDRYLWTTNSGNLENLPVDLLSVCFNNSPINGNQIEYGFSNDGGSSWFCTDTYLSPCSPPNPPPCSNDITFTQAPSSVNSCCLMMTVNASVSSPINSFYVDVPHASNCTSIAPAAGWNVAFIDFVTPTEDRFFFTKGSGSLTSPTEIGGFCGENFPNGSIVSYGFSNNGGTSFTCIGSYTLPTCAEPAECNIIIEAIPPVICNNQGSTITSTGYTGSGGNIEWFMSTVDPGTNQAPSNPWTQVGTGSYLNTGNLICNPPSEITQYWYQAILTDPNCTNSPVVTNVATVTVNPVFSLTLSGPMILCNPGSTILTLNGLDNNYSCPVIWMDLQTNLPINPVNNTHERQISLQGLTASLSDCPFKIYNYSVTVCDGICNPTIPISIKVYASSKSTNIVADRRDICMGEDTQLHLVDNNYCGDIQWQMKSVTGTAGQWVDIAGAANTQFWNTNRLIEHTEYRVKFTNGVCPPDYSPMINVFSHSKLTVSIDYFNQSPGVCPGLLCPSIYINASVIPLYNINVPILFLDFQWYLNGTVIPGTTGVSPLNITVPGIYNVVLTDPICGDVTSDSLVVYSFAALLSGPSCVCFSPGLVVDLTVTPNCATSGPFVVKLYKEPSTTPISTQTLTPNSNGDIILTGVAISPGDKFKVIISSPCGSFETNLYEPQGCLCPE
ncbi:MAG: hypothetical protein WAT71_07040 [Ignavibacteria bacterium]